MQQVVAQVLIPQAVFDEIARDQERPGALIVEQASWIERRSVSDTATTSAFPLSLGTGEREAILLAATETLPLLCDDRLAREEAHRRGVRVIGSLWVLGEAKRRGLIETVKPLIDTLLARGYWIHPERVVRPFLERMGEA